MDTLALILATLDRILEDHCDKALLDAAEAGQFAAPLWSVLEENGLTLLGAADSGTTLLDGYRVLQRAARHAMPLPLGEHVVATDLLAGVEEPPTGILTLALAPDEQDSARAVPWARDCDWILVARPGPDTCQVWLLAAADCEVERAVNMAGEPRDDVKFDSRAGRVLFPAVTFDALCERLALLRVVQMAGCLARTLELSLAYAQERVQFGRPISKFQAIQHQLAVLAGEVAAAGRAADAALERLGDEGLGVQVAAAKARVGEAAGVAAEIAHQVHGAMGFTHEHQLHHFTRRLWSWRDEHGNEAFWQQRLGRRIAAAGADRLWDFVTQH